MARQKEIKKNKEDNARLRVYLAQREAKIAVEALVKVLEKLEKTAKTEHKTLSEKVQEVFGIDVEANKLKAAHDKAVKKSLNLVHSLYHRPSEEEIHNVAVKIMSTKMELNLHKQGLTAGLRNAYDEAKFNCNWGNGNFEDCAKNIGNEFANSFLGGSRESCEARRGKDDRVCNAVGYEIGFSSSGNHHNGFGNSFGSENVITLTGSGADSHGGGSDADGCVMQ